MNKNNNTFLDDILGEVYKILGQSLDWEQKNSTIKEVLEARDNEKKSIFDLIKQQKLSKFFLLLGFCYKIGVGTTKDNEQAISCWEKEGTSYGHYKSETYEFG